MMKTKNSIGNMIYHITTIEQWKKYCNAQYYECPSLEEERFIHCSTKEQVQLVIRKYYHDQQDLVIFHIDTQLLKAECKYEVSTDNQSFPHIYGKLNINAIVDINYYLGNTITRCDIINETCIHPFDFNGIKIKDYTAGLSTPVSFAMLTVAPGSRHGIAYSIKSNKYYFVTKGEVMFQLGGRKVQVSANDFLIIPKGNLFDYENVSNAVAEMVLIHTPSFDLNAEKFV